MTFMTKKLKKNTPWEWTKENETQFRKIIDQVIHAHVKGFQKLFSPEKVFVSLCSDWCRLNNSSGAVALIRYEDPDDPEKVRAELAMCDSRQLAPTIANKSSTLGEVASLLASITALGA